MLVPAYVIVIDKMELDDHVHAVTTSNPLVRVPVSIAVVCGDVTEPAHKS
jgi:hypothetical protein